MHAPFRLTLFALTVATLATGCQTARTTQPTDVALFFSGVAARGSIEEAEFAYTAPSPRPASVAEPAVMRELPREPDVEWRRPFEVADAHYAPDVYNDIYSCGCDLYGCGCSLHACRVHGRIGCPGRGETARTPIRMPIRTPIRDRVPDRGRFHAPEVREEPERAGPFRGGPSGQLRTAGVDGARGPGATVAGARRESRSEPRRTADALRIERRPEPVATRRVTPERPETPVARPARPESATGSASEERRAPAPPRTAGPRRAPATR
jgi:hypothetical protein